MSDYITAFTGLFLKEENQLWLMFASSFLSATVLPGNSEIVFGALASQLIFTQNFSMLFSVFAIATLGNTLGSLTTYLMALLLPEPKIKQNQTATTQSAIRYAQQYGVWVLLFSWLPVIGDILCGVAGWLRFNPYWSFLLIMLGKAARYGVILWGIYAVLG